MTLKLQPGDRVLLELKNAEIYEGSVDHISPRSVELYDLLAPKTNTSFNGSMTFYKSEVLHVSKVSSQTQEVASTNDNDFPQSKKITMSVGEFNRLKQMTFDFIFVDCTGKRFDDAIDVLSNRESVAVAGLGNSYARGKGLGLLLMADFKQVYIFDMFCLGQLKGLQNILESPFITKVVHDGAALNDCLHYKYKVEMKNVFDTKVVDSMVSEKEGQVSRNISEILSHYFNFPPSLLSATLEDIINRAWMERPLAKNNKIKAAQLVTYLLPLRDELMAKILRPYSEAIENEYVKFKSRDLLKFK